MKYSREITENILTQYDAGKKISAISRRTGIAHQTITKIILAAGRPTAEERDRRIVEQQRVEVNRLTDQGKTLAEISDAVGISSSKVRYLRQEHRHKQLAERDRRIVELYKGGHTIRTIREHLKISYATVRRALDRQESK